MFTKNILAEKIKEQRNRLHLSQQEVADGIGISRSALSQIELGERKVSAEELGKLSSFFEVSIQELTQTDIVDAKEIEIADDDTYILKQLILYIAGKVANKPYFGETVLNKLLYFCDFDFYERNGEKTISNVTYVKLPFGPAPDCMKRVLEDMKREGCIEIVTRTYFNKTQHKIIPLVEADTTFFGEMTTQGGPTAKDIIDSVIERFSGRNADALSHRSHDDMPYKATKKIGESIEPGLVFYRSPAYMVNPNNAVEDDA